MVFQYYFCLWFSKTDQKLKVTLKYIQGSTRVRISHTPSRKKKSVIEQNQSSKSTKTCFSWFHQFFSSIFFMKWEVFKISAFTSLSSPHHPVMTSASLHMQNTCTTKNFIRENCQILTYSTSTKRISTYFSQFSCCIFSPIIHRKNMKIFKDLPASSSYFQRRALWYVNNREQKKGWMTQGFSWIFPWSSNSESTELLCTARRFYADFFALASDAFLSQGIIINILLYCRVGPKKKTNVG